MKVAVLGAGAIGGWMAVKLAQAGHAVSVLARGATLGAIRAEALQLIEGDATVGAAVTGSSAATQLCESPETLEKRPAIHTRPFASTIFWTSVGFGARESTGAQSSGAPVVAFTIARQVRGWPPTLVNAPPT